MKHSICLISLSFFVFLFSSNLSYAQELLAVNAPVQSGNNVYESNALSEGSTMVPVSAAILAETNPKLIRNFSQLFPTTEKVSWSKMNNGFYASFDKDGQHTSAVFTNNGLLNYTITSCSLEQLPATLQQSISKKYNGYRLFNASQIRSNGTEAYNVVLENANGFVTLQHTEDGTAEIKKVNKLAVN